MSLDACLNSGIKKAHFWAHPVFCCCAPWGSLEKGMASHQLRACCSVHMVCIEHRDRSKQYAARERILYMNNTIRCVCLLRCPYVWVWHQEHVYVCGQVRRIYILPHEARSTCAVCLCLFVCGCAFISFTPSYVAPKESIPDRLQHGVHMLYSLSTQQAGDECLRRLPSAAWRGILMCCSVTSGCA